MTGPAAPQSASYRYYVVALLVAVNTVNFIDRQAISVLGPAIQAEFNISNTLLGVVMGIAFTAFYATLGFPIARLADRKSRVNILAVVAAVWGVMTALCGAAANFVMLFLFRVGVGVGEAGAGPCAHSLIGDYFSRGDRPRMIGLFSVGVPMGIFLGIVLAGQLVEPLGWRWTFVVLGAPGVVLAVLVKLTIREPVRGVMDPEIASEATADVKIMEVVKRLWAMKTYRIMSYSAALSALAGYGMNFWTPTFLQRIHDLAPAEYSLPFGIATGLGGGLGAFAGGWLTGRAVKRTPSAFFAYPAGSMVLFSAAVAVTVTANSLTLVYLSVLVSSFAQFFLMGPFFGLVQRLAPLRGRAVATAFYFFILSIVGLGIGLAYVGAVNDLLAGWLGQAEGLRYSMMTLVVISLVAAAIAFFGRGVVEQDIATRESAATPPPGDGAAMAART